MGARNLTCVVLDNEVKVAQYGQWDGYPTCNGVEICKFIQENLKNNSPVYEALVGGKDFTNRVRALGQWSENEFDDLANKVYPVELSGDTGTDILNLINNGEVKRVFLNTDFANDSLMCEFVYVLDLDNDMLEVYTGFQTKPHSDGRFSTAAPTFLKHSGDIYHSVKLKCLIPFSEALPEHMADLEQYLNNEGE